MLSLSSSERPRCERTRYADSNASSSAADESPPGTAAYCERPEPWSARAGLARRIRYASPAPARHMKHSSEPTTATPASAVADSDEGRSAGFVPRAVGRGDPIGRALGARVGAAVGALEAVGDGVGNDVGAGLGRHDPHAYAEEGAAEGGRHGRRRGEWVHRFEFSELHKPKAIRCTDEPAQKLNSGLRSVSHRGKDDDKAVVYAVRHRPALRRAVRKVSPHPSVFPHPSVSLHPSHPSRTTPLPRAMLPALRNPPRPCFGRGSACTCDVRM